MNPSHPWSELIEPEAAVEIRGGFEHTYEVLSSAVMRHLFGPDFEW